MSFGKRNFVRSALADDDVLVRRADGVLEGPAVERLSANSSILPEIHNTHLERHWPRYGAIAFAIFAAFFTFNDQAKGNLQITLLTGLLAGGFSYFILIRFHNSLNRLHTLRTAKTRSKFFILGVVLGLTYWIYSTFISPTVLLGHEIGPQTAFKDGFQRQDLFAVAQLLLSAAVYAGLGGALVSFFETRFIKPTKKDENAA